MCESECELKEPIWLSVCGNTWAPACCCICMQRWMLHLIPGLRICEPLLLLPFSACIQPPAITAQSFAALGWLPALRNRIRYAIKIYFFLQVHEAIVRLNYMWHPRERKLNSEKGICIIMGKFAAVTCIHDHLSSMNCIARTNFTAFFFLLITT